MNKRFLFSLGFNIIETLIIFMIGKIFNVESNLIFAMMLIFFFTRLICGQPKHFATWYRCLVWSLLIFTSLYALTDLNIFVIILMTVFTAYILSGKADINDIYQWKGRDSKYSDIDEFLKFNELNDRVIEFENKIKQQDNLLFLLYKYRFKENYTFAEISDKTGLENPRIAEKLDKIAFSLRIFCGI